MSWRLIDRGAVDACWLWTGRRDRDGYGQFGRHDKAHRWAWEQANGKAIPAGMVIRHTCDNPPCCNPAHLILGTQADNMIDMWAKGRRPRLWGGPLARSQATHCIHGHPFNEENTYIHPQRGRRMCRACGRERTRRYRSG